MCIRKFVANWRRVLLASAAIVAAFGGVSTSTPAAELRITQNDTAVSIFDGDRPILHYRFTSSPTKPYADQLFSPAGVQILRDSPSDHKHHHGLMYAQFVDGVNFWEENDSKKCGSEKHKSLADVKSTNRDGVGRAGFTQELDWIGPASDKPLLFERREIAVLRAADLGATLVDWRIGFRTPPGKESATLGGHFYNGLGMRFVESMDAGGRFFNADDKTGEVVRGNQRLTPAKWCAYAAKADGKPVTVAMFDHPDNIRHPAKMFTMSEKFAYLSITRNEWKQPIELKAGEPLNLRYGVALWDGAPDKAAVEKLYQRWLKL